MKIKKVVASLKNTIINNKLPEYQKEFIEMKGLSSQDELTDDLKKEMFQYIAGKIVNKANES